jgi:hypothetical protein
MPSKVIMVMPIGYKAFFHYAPIDHYRQHPPLTTGVQDLPSL